VGDEVIWKRPAGDLSIEVTAIDYAVDDDSSDDNRDDLAP